jgi:hypothetical protein
MSGPIAPTEIPSDKPSSIIHHKEIEKSPYIHESSEIVDRVAEKKLLWKVDLHVVPALGILYMLAFLDRINIGNAKIQNMTTELHMVGNDYSIALFIFFIP